MWSHKNLLKNKRTAAMMSALLAPFAVSAQDAAGTDSSTLLLLVILLVFIVSILVLAVAGYTLQILRVFVRKEEERKAVEAGVELEPQVSLWQKIQDKLTDRVPVEREEEVLLDHDYDGIRELDNHLPPWWKYLFYFTIVWGIIYLFVYHVIDALPLSHEEYETEMALAEEAKQARLANMDIPEIDEETVQPVDDPAALADGQQIFNMQCAACHNQDGSGGIGPNLTDNYWLHGGSMSDVYKTVKNGVPDKGMIAWDAVLNPVQIQNVSSYVLTLVGTNPPNPKDPQGELYEPGAEEAGDSETDESADSEETAEEDEATDVPADGESVEEAAETTD